MLQTQTVAKSFDWAGVRRLVLKAVVWSVVAAAGIAIFSVIVGTFGILQLKLFFVIALFIAFTLLALFDAEVSVKQGEAYATAGILVNAYLLVAGIFMIAVARTDNPGGFGDGSIEAVLRAFGNWVVLLIIARVALALVLAFVAMRNLYRHPQLTLLLRATVAMLGVFALLLSLPVIVSSVDFPSAYYRALGVSVILTVLGGVLIPLIGRFFGEVVERPTRAPQPYTPPVNVTQQGPAFSPTSEESARGGVQKAPQAVQPRLYTSAEVTSMLGANAATREPVQPHSVSEVDDVDPRPTAERES